MINIKIILLLSLAAYEASAGGNSTIEEEVAQSSVPVYENQVTHSSMPDSEEKVTNSFVPDFEKQVTDSSVPDSEKQVTNSSVPDFEKQVTDSSMSDSVNQVTDSSVPDSEKQVTDSSVPDSEKQVTDSSLPDSEKQGHCIDIFPTEESIVKTNKPGNRGKEIAQTSEPESPNTSVQVTSRSSGPHIFDSGDQFNNQNNSTTRIYNNDGCIKCQKGNKTALLVGGKLKFQGEEVPGCNAMVRPILIQWERGFLWVNTEHKPTFNNRIDGKGSMLF